MSYIHGLPRLTTFAGQHENEQQPCIDISRNFREVLGVEEQVRRENRYVSCSLVGESQP